MHAGLFCESGGFLSHSASYTVLRNVENYLELTFFRLVGSVVGDNVLYTELLQFYF